MRVKDIRPGVEYAYREGQYGSFSKAVLVGKPGQLYETGYRTYKVTESSTTARTRTSKIYGPRGYLFAVGHDVTGASLDDALERGLAYDNDKTFRYFILAQCRSIHGPYEEVLAEKERQDKLEAEQRQRQRDYQANNAAKVARAVDALARRGIRASHGYSMGGQLELNADQAQKLAELLEGQQPGE